MNAKRRSSRPSRIVLLVEDQLTERFARKVLYRFKYKPRDIAIIPYPVGTSSAKQWVQQKYPEELKNQRSKFAYQNLAILIVTDADQQTVGERMRELDDHLKTQSVPNRKPDEPVAFWIPKWSIETWLLYFHLGQILDESIRLKHQFQSCDFKAVAERFADEYRDHKAGVVLATQPSLIPAYSEFTRFSL